MSLWTPYSQDSALDLSKDAVPVKAERLSPVPDQRLSPVDPAFYPYPYNRVPEYIPHYGYPPAEAVYNVPSALMSPESVSSRGSQYQQVPAMPSPPESPDAYDVEALAGDMEYQAFERDALQAMAEKNGGSLLGNNPRMRRAVQTSQAAGSDYRQQRERNNLAAKQSRDRRKLREVRLALQVTFLKKKVADMKARLAAGMCSRCHHSCVC